MKPRILIVDDDEAITQQLFWTLCEDYDVVTANDMQTAVRRATIYEPDLSILDPHLPPASDSPEIGLRVIEYIKAHFPKSKVLVLATTGTLEKLKTGYGFAADEFLGKPFDTEQLLRTMRRMAPQQVEVI
jgi:DNA-binding response OmpR family regulator